MNPRHASLLACCERVLLATSILSASIIRWNRVSGFASTTSPRSSPLGRLEAAEAELNAAGRVPPRCSFASQSPRRVDSQGSQRGKTATTIPGGLDPVWLSSARSSDISQGSLGRPWSLPQADLLLPGGGPGQGRSRKVPTDDQQENGEYRRSRLWQPLPRRGSVPVTLADGPSSIDCRVRRKKASRRDTPRRIRCEADRGPGAGQPQDGRRRPPSPAAQRHRRIRRQRELIQPSSGEQVVVEHVPPVVCIDRAGLHDDLPERHVKRSGQ